MNANQVELADQQQKSYLGCKPSISVGQKVLLNNPTKGKLGLRWTGPWKVTALKGPTTIVLKIGCTERVVHANRVRPLLIDEDAGADHGVLTDWSPPLFHYNENVSTPSLVENEQAEQNQESTVRTSPPDVEETPSSPPPLPITTRSGRQVKPVQRYGHS